MVKTDFKKYINQWHCLPLFMLCWIANTESDAQSIISLVNAKYRRIELAPHKTQLKKRLGKQYYE